MTEARAAPRPWLALLLLAPAPSVGAFAALALGDNPLGVAIWALCKAWLLLFPAVWHLVIARQRAVLPRPTRRSLAVGAATGGIIAMVILGAYGLVGRHWIDPAQIRGVLTPLGLGDPAVYVTVAVYWITVNAALEEYVYRWFLFDQCRRWIGDGPAVFASGLIFVAHHVIALSSYFDATVTAVACLGVFIGGVVWSVQYLWQRNLWGCVLSHAITDIAVFGIGAVLLFA